MKCTVKPIALTVVLFVAAALLDACTARKESPPEGERIAAAPAPAVTCESLTYLTLPDTTIKSATSMSTPTPYCKVVAVVTPATHPGDHRITIEVWMPSSGWNGKFQGVGNGGFAGSINTFSMFPALAAGYATAGTDTGHRGNAVDASWARYKPGLVADFGWRAIHAMTDTAKAVITAFYGVGPSRSYFIGCSTGGRQALMEAQRYPGDYNGIVAGAPGNYTTHIQFGRNWNSKAVHDDPLSVIPASKLPAIAAAVLARCDRRDGLADGVIDDPRHCRWDPSAIRCDGVESDACLTSPQVKGLQKLYRGAPRQVFPGFLRGGEVGPKGEVGPDGAFNLGGWGTWIVGTSQDPETNHVLQDTFFKYMVFEDRGFDWRTLDFGDDVTFTDAKLAAMLNATDPDLEPFRALGGKLLIYHGWSDPAIPAVNSVNYYETVLKTMQQLHGLSAAQTGNFARLFLAPGMQHCAGGPGPHSFDVRSAIDQWVMSGTAPDRIIAAHTTGGRPDRTRPLCPYPQVARHDGSGSTDDAANFDCVDK